MPEQEELGHVAGVEDPCYFALVRWRAAATQRSPCVCADRLLSSALAGGRSIDRVLASTSGAPAYRPSHRSMRDLDFSTRSGTWLTVLLGDGAAGQSAEAGRARQRGSVIRTCNARRERNTSLHAADGTSVCRKGRTLGVGGAQQRHRGGETWTAVQRSSASHPYKVA